MTEPRTASARDPMFPFRTVVIGTFLPTILFEMGVGAVIPVVAARAGELGASLTVAGAILAMLAVGQILADLPAGALAARLGDRTAMALAGVIGTAAAILAGLAPSPLLLGVAILLMGAAAATFFLARQSHLTEITPPLRRARVLSTLGGMHRVGYFIGPFAGALVITLWSVAAVFVMAAALSLLASLVVLLAAGDERGDRATASAPVLPAASLWSEYRGLFLRLGLAVLLIGAVRGARNTVLPLWAEYVGIDPASTSVIFGISAGVDTLLFYPAGYVMDRFGRLAVGVPAMGVMGLALAFIPLATTPVTLGVVSVLLGLGNGMSSGILMTLGSDVAPPERRAKFLGIWRLFSDTGLAVGPLVLTAAAAAGSLAAGVWAMAAASGASMASQLRWVPRYTDHASNATRRAAGLPVWERKRRGG